MPVKKKYSITKSQLIFSCATLFALAAALCTVAYFMLVYNEGFKEYIIWPFFGLVALCILMLGFYIYYRDISIMQKRKNIIVFCGILFVSYTFFTLLEQKVSPFAVPYAFCALLISLCFSKRSGFSATLTISMIMFFANAFFGQAGALNNYVPVAVGFSTAVLGGFVYSKRSLRIKYVLVAVCNTVAAAIISLILTVSFDYNSFASVWLANIAYGALANVIAISAFFLFVPIMDSVLGFVTDFRLAELSSTDQPLLKKLYNEAPGTFNHCVTLANYAVQCATAINENSYLARTAAYYHDIGKLKNPLYFSENQSDGVNAHDELTPEVSVSIIKKHIVNGIALAKKEHLPDEVISAIAEHHGTLPLRFFYNKAQKYSETDLEDVKYRYEGLKPSTKISALIMVCDACEATLRAVSPGSREEAEKIVASVINERIKYEQFSDCDITLRDFELIKQTIVTVYGGISHQRINYPKAKETDGE